MCLSCGTWFAIVRATQIVADFVAERADRVTILTELPVLGQGIEAANQLMLMRRLLDHGVDVAIDAATKYIVGHADAMLGAITSATVGFSMTSRPPVAVATGSP